MNFETYANSILSEDCGSCTKDIYPPNIRGDKKLAFLQPDALRKVNEILKSGGKDDDVIDSVVLLKQALLVIEKIIYKKEK